VVKELIRVEEHERRAPELALALDPRLGLASQFALVLLFDFREVRPHRVSRVRHRTCNARWVAVEVRQHESSGLFLAFNLLAFQKKLDKDFYCSSNKKKYAFGMALLVAASPRVQKRRG
jgi:hypothetical protein